MSEPVGLALESIGMAEPNATVVLSSELISLLSAQLYQSPIKAVEELVVNSYDADADNCWVRIAGSRILVIDDGVGMSQSGIQDLWHVGHSTKRDKEVADLRKRKQIGKFGIGKLATAAIANRVTYITKAKGHDKDQVLSTSVNYSDFKSAPSGASTAVALKVRRISVVDVLAQSGLKADVQTAGCNTDKLGDTDSGWTIVLLENLKPEASELQVGRLRWVLSTAMPRAADFKLFLDGKPVVSSKDTADDIVSFDLKDLNPDRLANLTTLTEEEWTVGEIGLTSPSFPLGIRGRASVTRQTLYGKSDDLQRSHGFFVRVRGRLVNLDDPLFGLKPSTHSIVNRFYCDLEADDLDEVLTAPREGVEVSTKRKKFLLVLNEIFNQARSGYEAWAKSWSVQSTDKKHKEHERNYVNPRLVERPIADAILAAAEQAAAAAAIAGTRDGEEVDDQAAGDEPASEHSASKDVAEAGWFYLQLPLDFNLSDLTKSLYSDEREESYRYERMSLGRTQPMVRFDPTQALFKINTDHDMVRAHDDNAEAQKLLEDIATAEALLEVYLREQGLDHDRVEEVLSRRDELLRSLTKDRVYSLKAIAADLRESADNEMDLEVQLVVAARALGFLARHIGGSDDPDGIARLVRHPGGEVKITLEAKSSGKEAAGLAAIGFDALAQHIEDQEAAGCLLVAPGYPGGSKGDQAAAAKRAVTAKVSCWTVEQLAAVVENAQLRNFTAGQVLDIIQHKFRPEDVAAAVNAILTDPRYSDQDLYRAILRALRGLQGVMRGNARTAEIILSRLTLEPEFADLEELAVREALRDMAGTSGGAMTYDGAGSGRIVVHVDLDELERRVGSLLGSPGTPRHAGGFTVSGG